MSIKVEIEWVERNKRYMTVEVDSIEELSDFKPILREGKEHWSKLENNSIQIKPKCECCGTSVAYEDDGLCDGCLELQHMEE